MAGPLPLLWQQLTTAAEVVVFLHLLLVITIYIEPISAARPSPIDVNSRQQVVAGKGVVAADDVRCSTIGVGILKDGGNAVDAAVATALCLGVVGPGSSGIGGGSFMVIRMADGRTAALDMRSVAPLNATEGMYFFQHDAKIRGPLSIAVPGELAGTHEAWKLYGRHPWAKLVQPAIDLAENGYILSKYVFYQMNVNTSAIMYDPGLCSVFTVNPSMCSNPEYSKNVSNLKQPGDLIKNIQLAKTLKIIQQQGAEAFYNGSVAKDLLADLNNFGSMITAEDLSGYEVKHRDPLVSDVFNGTYTENDGVTLKQKSASGLQVITVPPPSSGGACVILALHVSELFGLPEGVDNLLGRHRYAETSRHVFVKREYVGDPDFNASVAEYVNQMIGYDMAKDIRKKIHDKLSPGPNPVNYGAEYDPIPSGGTSHMSIIDEERNAVAFTTSVNYHFGSLYMSPSTGVVLNNDMNDFSTHYEAHTHPAPNNLVQPKKRPVSSMSPTIILKNGQLQGVIGASGGPLIILATSRVFLNHFGLEMDPLASVMLPRLYMYQVDPTLENLIYYENFTTCSDRRIEIPSAIVDYLTNKNNNLTQAEGEYAICQFVIHNFETSGNLVGVSDPRKGGYPAGY